MDPGPNFAAGALSSSPALASSPALSSSPALPSSPALAFGTVAENYARSRPSYPGAGVDFVLKGMQPQHILDLGAGTGKLTEVLLGRAPGLLAVDPDPAMLAELSRSLPAVRTAVGCGERVPVPDDSIDAVFIGQALHWFDRPAADYELARILRPGGVVGLLWNFPDTATDWVAALYDCTTGQSPARLAQRSLMQGLFDTAEQRWFSAEHKIAGPRGLIDLVHTWSWVISQPPPAQIAIDDELWGLIQRYPQLQTEVITLPTRTKVVRQYRR